MTARLLDGRALAATIETTLRDEVATFVEMFKRRPRLVVVLVGELAASASYVKSKAAAAAREGRKPTRRPYKWSDESRAARRKSRGA